MKKVLSKEGIWHLMYCMLYRPDVNGLLAGEVPGGLSSEKCRTGMRAYSAWSSLSHQFVPGKAGI